MMAQQTASLRIIPHPLVEALQLTLALTPSTEGEKAAQREIVTALGNAFDARRQRIVVSQSQVNLIKWSCSHSVTHWYRHFAQRGWGWSMARGSFSVLRQYILEFRPGGGEHDRTPVRARRLQVHEGTRWGIFACMRLGAHTPCRGL